MIENIEAHEAVAKARRPVRPYGSGDLLAFALYLAISAAATLLIREACGGGLLGIGL